MKNVLVTGGAGFIGSHLIDRLLSERDWNVTVLDDFNSSYSPVLKYHNIATHSENRSFSLFGGDINSESVLEGIFSGQNFDCVVHLADKTDSLEATGESGDYERTNVYGTLNLLEAARAGGVRQFVFGSSASVYGNDLPVPFREQTKSSRPISPYAATKAFGEMLCETYSTLYGIRCVCLRFFTVYGPRQRPDMAVYRFTDRIEAGRPVVLRGDETSKRDYVFVSDAIDGIRCAMDYDKSPYEIINIGTGRSVKLTDLVGILQNALNREAIIEQAQPKAGEMRITLADTQKARTLLDFSPTISLEKGIEAFVRWFRAERPRENGSNSVNLYSYADAVN